MGVIESSLNDVTAIAVTCLGLGVILGLSLVILRTITFPIILLLIAVASAEGDYQLIPILVIALIIGGVLWSKLE